MNLEFGIWNLEFECRIPDSESSIPDADVVVAAGAPDRHGSTERVAERIGGEHLALRAVGGDAPSLQQHYAIDLRQDLVHVVRDEQDRSALAREGAHALQELVARDEIEP